MSYLQLNEQYEHLLSWATSFKKTLETEYVLRNRNQLQHQLFNYQRKLEALENQYLTLEAIQRLSIEAEELYCEYEKENKNLESERKEQQNSDGRVPIGEHKLPSLPYAYDALEPYIDKEIMRLHHSEHHKSYVEGLNKAEKEMEKARKKGEFDLIKHWEREVAFHGAGHYLHTIFWNAMSPRGGGTPKGSLAQQINLDFGSFQQFKEHFSEAAKNVEAVGWTILVWARQAGRLEILQAEKHQNLSQWDVIPILPLDVWEHAYYLQYKNERKLYVENWWNVVNWDYANVRFEKARQLQ